MEREHVIPFAVGVGTRCVYLEPTQVYIAHVLWMTYEKPMNDVQEKEKAHRQGGANRTYSWPKERCIKAELI